MTMNPDVTLTHEERNADQSTVLGFWTYLMTDLMVFASLFAVYAVLQAGVWNGPSPRDLFSPTFVLTETLILLASSFTCGLMFVAAGAGRKVSTLAALAATLLLGGAFLWLEVSEFVHLATHGASWQASAFLSAYFTLVGTHGLHIAIGLLWGGALALALWVRGLTRSNLRKLALFGLFWHFLDIVWIFIFTVVYLMGLS